MCKQPNFTNTLRHDYKINIQVVVQMQINALLACQ